MQKFRVEKLIRDHLPRIMRESGLSVFERTMPAAEFEIALRAKLVEEAREAQTAATDEDLIDELADLAEVVLALRSLRGLSAEAIEDARLRKRVERGGFDGRIWNAAVGAERGTPALAYYLARPAQYPPLEEAEA